jgi:hypothetical protein
MANANTATEHPPPHINTKFYKPPSYVPPSMPLNDPRTPAAVYQGSIRDIESTDEG